MKVLLIGRFQPFHKGHLNSILRLYKDGDLLKIAIGSKQLSFENKNPFTFDERREMIENSLKASNVKNFAVYGIEDVNSDKDWLKLLEKTVGKFDVCYTNNKKVFSIVSDGKKPVKRIKRFGREKFSGTRVRMLIRMRKNVESLLPQGTLKVIRKTDGFSRIRDTSRKKRMFTIGHSTRSINDFIALLKDYGITSVVDIRTIPRSLHNPQFNAGTLGKKLAENGIDYIIMKSLGGLRKADKDSVNTFWKNDSFRGFADYMQTNEFKKGINVLSNYAKGKRVAIMCAETLPWRCHRSLISDMLLVKGFSVTHIIDFSETREHRLNKSATKRKGSLVYGR